MTNSKPPFDVIRWMFIGREETEIIEATRKGKTTKRRAIPPTSIFPTCIELHELTEDQGNLDDRKCEAHCSHGTQHITLQLHRDHC